jgi:CO/xanthine dehydrogenase Mo-binding subunit
VVTAQRHGGELGRCCFSCGEVHAHADLHDRQRPPCSARARQCARIREDGIFEIHTGNQWQTLILPVLSKALGLPQERIVLRTYDLGGGFGRRLNGDYAVPAALAAKALGKPVKMVLTRPDDTQNEGANQPSTAGQGNATQHQAPAHQNQPPANQSNSGSK